jgi:hypothetical protein
LHITTNFKTDFTLLKVFLAAAVSPISILYSWVPPIIPPSIAGIRLLQHTAQSTCARDQPRRPSPSVAGRFSSTLLPRRGRHWHRCCMDPAMGMHRLYCHGLKKRRIEEQAGQLQR